MKKRRFISIVVFQMTLLLLMIAYKQYSVYTGETIRLHLQRPVDPRSVFSGNYVILSYDISTLNQSLARGESFNYGDTVYVALSKQGEYWVPASIEKIPPKKIFIKGTVASSWGGSIQARYDIEQFYIPDSRAKEMEERLRIAERSGDAYAEVVIDGNGNAIVSKVFLGVEELV